MSTKDPRDPFVRAIDPPEDVSAREALAANLRERARILEQAGPTDVAPILRTFDHPSWHGLHAQERSQADGIAEHAATTIFGVNTRDRLTNRLAADLEQAATYVTRRIHPEFVQAAHEQAVDTLIQSDEYRALMRERSPAEARILAHRLVTQVRAAMFGVLEGTIPLTPIIYLRMASAQAERGAR